MGQEIKSTGFCADDFTAFSARLATETDIFEQLERAGDLEKKHHVVGFELESWLLDHNYFPLPENERVLTPLGSSVVSPELSRFNIEVNVDPQPLQSGTFRRLEEELTSTWKRCLDVAHEFAATLIMIGILPTIRERDLTLANMSVMKRYRALNEQVLRARGGRPIRLDIRGREHLQLIHQDVMLEAATTSFQIHLQVPAPSFARYLNASTILSAPLVAIAANSPFLFGASLWDETRIPLFEQAVDTTGGPSGDSRPRVNFGSGYVTHGAAECFRENLRDYAVLLPMCCDDSEGFPHLRLHNGTIWRWNRPLVGFDEAGVPHIRIEHRVMPAGPSIIDMIANSALYVGAVHNLATRSQPVEAILPFETARRNFYAAARDGLAARIEWPDNRSVDVGTLLLEEILPSADEGLRALGIEAEEREYYLDVVTARARSGQNGAVWQRRFVEKHGRDFFALTSRYLENQRSGMPVHAWTI